MRIDINSELRKELDKIKAAHRWNITGRGHTETVRYLVEYYKENQSLEKIHSEIRQTSTAFILKLDENLRLSLEKVLPKAFANVVSNLLLAKVQTEDKRASVRLRDPTS